MSVSQVGNEAHAGGVDSLYRRSQSRSVAACKWACPSCGDRNPVSARSPSLCVLRPITTSSNANAAKAAEILTYLFIIFPFHGCLDSGPAEDGEGGLWATPGLRTPVAPTGLGHQGPALERVPHRLTQSRRFVRLSVNAGLATSFRQQHNQRSLPRCSCSRQNPLHCQVPSS